MLYVLDYLTTFEIKDFFVSGEIRSFKLLDQGYIAQMLKLSELCMNSAGLLATHHIS